MTAHVTASPLRIALLLGLSAALLHCSPPAGPMGPKKEKSSHEKAEYHYKLATGLLYEKKPIAALRELDKALHIEPGHAKSHYLLGFIYMGRRNYGEALVHLKRAVELNPKLYEAVTGLAGTYMALQRWQEALDVLKPLLEDPLNPSPWLAHNNAGWCFFKLGDRAKALEHLQMAVFLNQKFCLGYYNLGLVLRESRRLEAARLRLERARSLCPKHAQMHLALGEVYEELGRRENARNAYRTCREQAEGTMLGERCRAREEALQ